MHVINKNRGYPNIVKKNKKVKFLYNKIYSKNIFYCINLCKSF